MNEPYIDTVRPPAYQLPDGPMVRDTVAFMVAGLTWRLLLSALPFDAPLWVVLILSSSALAVPVVVALVCTKRRIGRPILPLLFAFPYPFRFAFDLYAHRTGLLPDSPWADNLNGPTAFYLVISAVLLLSIPCTAFCLRRSVELARGRVLERSGESLRRIGYTLFALTGVAVLLPVPEWGIAFLRTVPELFSLSIYGVWYTHALRAEEKGSVYYR